jgi:hypothetical protein
VVSIPKVTTKRLPRSLRAPGVQAGVRCVRTIDQRQLRINPRGVSAGEVVDGHSVRIAGGKSMPFTAVPNVSVGD